MRQHLGNALFRLIFRVQKKLICTCLYLFMFVSSMIEDSILYLNIFLSALTNFDCFFFPFSAEFLKRLIMLVSTENRCDVNKWQPPWQLRTNVKPKKKRYKIPIKPPISAMKSSKLYTRCEMRTKSLLLLNITLPTIWSVLS